MTETIVTLKIKNGDTSTPKQVEIEEIDGNQLEAALNLAKEVLSLVDTQPALKEIMDKLTEDNVAKKKTAKAEDKDFVKLAVNAFELLLTHIPSKAFDLLSILSGIERELLMTQKYTKLFEILDASLEANDLELLANRAKKSFSGLAMKYKFNEKVKKALNLAKR